MQGEDFLRLEDNLRGPAETRQAIMQLSISVPYAHLHFTAWVASCCDGCCNNTHHLRHDIDRLKLQDVAQGCKGASVCMVVVYASCLVLLLSEVHETDYAVYLLVACM